MISRRNIRVKVMQVLYALESMEDSNLSIQTSGKGLPDPIKMLDKQFELSKQLLIYTLHFLAKLAGYAEEDSRFRTSKHLPSFEDLNVNTKLAGNKHLWSLIELPDWQEAMKSEKPHLLLDNELLRKMYHKLAETEVYKKYISEDSREDKSEKAIIIYLFEEILFGDEDFINHLEELFSNWNDDGEMILQLVQHFLSKPKTFILSELLGDEKRKFANDLLKAVVNKKEIALDYIKPRLKIWDAERIAVLDMILMRMGVCELLFFETIPPKVTINEYIDLAKDYSTPQSGQFINGLLDSIHKDLVKDEKLQKTAFKSNKYNK
jgi:N utilization substance protein B